MTAPAAGSAAALRDLLDGELPAIEAALGRWADDLLDGAPESVAAPIRYALTAGGKRVRPLLCLAAYRAVTGRTGSSPIAAAGDAGIYGVAAAVELVHTYSLVHDDLPCMDDDDLRRGRPATHRAFDVPRAAVAGVAMIPLACQALERGARDLGLVPQERAALVRELCVAAGGGGMVGGQLLDLEAEGRQLDAAELERLHRRKTGALLTAAVRLGAMAGRAGKGVLDAVGRYGRGIGLAFQIADDVLDVTGTSAALGKAAGKDRMLSKATYPALVGVAPAMSRAATEVRRAKDSLRDAGVAAGELAALADFIVGRDR